MRALGLLPLALLASCAPSDIPLTAKVAHQGPMFLVQNNDSYNWGNCDLYLNSEYSLKGINIEAGATYKVSAQDFAKKDGTRFNFLSTKPLKFYIQCHNAPTNMRFFLSSWK